MTTPSLRNQDVSHFDGLLMADDGGSANNLLGGTAAYIMRRASAGNPWNAAKIFFTPFPPLAQGLSGLDRSHSDIGAID